MHSLPTRLQTLLDAISHCAKQHDSKAFLHGDTLLYQLTENEELLLNKKIDIIISYDVNFDVHELYQCLIRHVVISKEIESSDTFYHIASMGFELKINLAYQFDPTRLVQAKQFGRFNIDILFYDLINKELRHPSEISEDTATLVNVNDPENWIFEDILGFARKIGTFSDIKIDENQKQKLKNISLATIRESLNISWEEEIEDILLARHSGSALQFLSDTFVDGMPWMFKTLVDYMISLNVPINEESTIETVFNEKKFNLVNLYNDYFLAEKKSFETSDEVHHRLTTTLKLLFDSPNLTIAKPYVNRIRTMAGGVLGRCCLGTDVGGTRAFFGCGENIDEIDCLSLPPLCSAGSNDCLKEHPAFAHIPENNWQILGGRLIPEWCPDQICPDADSIHCLQEVSSSSSSWGKDVITIVSSSSSSSQSSSSSSSSHSSSSSSSSSKSSSSSSKSSSSSSSSSSNSSSSSSSSSSSRSSSSSSRDDIVVENQYSSTEFDTDEITHTNVVVPAGTNRAIYVMIAGKQLEIEGGKYATAVAFSGEPFTLLGEAEKKRATVQIWRLLAPTVKTANIVITFAADATKGGVAYGIEVLSRVDPADPEDDWETPSTGDSSGNTTASHAVSTAGGDLVYSILSVETFEASLTESGDGTEVWNLSASASANGGVASFTSDSYAANMSWAITSDPFGSDWVMGGVSINPA